MARPVTHVIFDMDGLLINTEDLYTKALSKFCSNYGKEFTIEIKLKMMGRKPEEGAQLLIDTLDLPCSVSDYKSYLRTYQKEFFCEAELLPGAEKLVKHLHSNHIPIAIATGSDSESYKIKTSRHQNFMSRFQHVVMSGSDSEVTRGKPAPDIFLIAAKRFASSGQGEAPKPENCLVFEDAPNGVRAAVAAGMQCVLVPSVPSSALDAAIVKQATLKLDSLEQFDPSVFGLPSYLL